MKILAELYKNNGFLHHAYLIEGDADVLSEELVDFFGSTLGIRTKGNPDFSILKYNNFGISEARSLSFADTRKSFAGSGKESKKIFIINFQSITVEGQNALLKVFEEPSPSTHFFIILNSGEMLLPTLRSRLFEIRGEEKRRELLLKRGESFICMNNTERNLLIKKVVADRDEENSHTVSEAILLLDALEVALAERMRADSRNTQARHAIREVMLAKKYIRDRAPSVKMLLEHVSVLI